jgi:DNA primase
MTARHPESLTAGGIQVNLSHTDKLLFPGDDEVAKGDLIEYYAGVTRARPTVCCLCQGRRLNRTNRL